MKKNFTLIEMLVVIAIIGILAGMLSGPLMKARRKAQLIQCTNNLKQIGTALLQYEMSYNSAPQYASTENAGEVAGNLMLLYVTGLNDNLQGFLCPVANYTISSDNATASTTKVDSDKDNGCKFTSYNLTTYYSQGDPSNKIIAADVPYATGNQTASAHDSEANKIDDGPNCLYKDGHVTNEKNLKPQGSSEYDLDSTNGNIYAKTTKDGNGNGKGKDTWIKRGAAAATP